MKLYIISNQTNECVAVIEGDTNEACEAVASIAYGNTDYDGYSWTYAPAFGFVGGAVAGIGEKTH